MNFGHAAAATGSSGRNDIVLKAVYSIVYDDSMINQVYQQRLLAFNSEASHTIDENPFSKLSVSDVFASSPSSMVAQDLILTSSTTSNEPYSPLNLYFLFELLTRLKKFVEFLSFIGGERGYFNFPSLTSVLAILSIHFTINLLQFASFMVSWTSASSAMGLFVTKSSVYVYAIAGVSGLLYAVMETGYFGMRLYLIEYMSSYKQLLLVETQGTNSIGK